MLGNLGSRSCSLIQICLKKIDVNLVYLTNADMLLMFDTGIKGAVVVHRNAQANNKNMKDYDPNTELSYIICWNVDNLYVQTMQQKLPVNCFRWKKKKAKFTHKSKQSYDDESYKGHVPEVDVRYSKLLPNIHSGIPFLPKRMNIGKCQKLVRNAFD